MKTIIAALLFVVVTPMRGHSLVTFPLLIANSNGVL